MPSSAASYLANKTMGVTVLTVPVIYAGVSVPGHFRDDTDVTEDGAGTVLTDLRSVLIRTGALPTLTRGASVTVSGVPYVVRDTYRHGDGTLTRVVLVAS